MKSKVEKIVDVDAVEHNSKPKSEAKEKAKVAAKEAGLAIMEGLAFSFKTIRQGLKWASEDPEKKAPAPRPKKKSKDRAQVIIIR